MTSGSQSFFQVAVGLIPGLIFAGALLERRADERRAINELPSGLRVAIVTFLTAGVVAQVLAIRGAIEPNLDRSQQYFVVVVVVSGTFGIALLTVWLLNLLPRTSLPQFAVAAVGTAVVAVFTVAGSLDKSNARFALNEASDRSLRDQSELDGASAERRAARTELLGMADEAGLANTVRQYLDALDRVSISDRDATRRPRVKAAFAALSEVGRESHDRIRDLELPESAEDLALLAVERVEEAEGGWLSARINSVSSERTYETACREAASVGCKSD